MKPNEGRRVVSTIEAQTEDARHGLGEEGQAMTNHQGDADVISHKQASFTAQTRRPAAGLGRVFGGFGATRASSLGGQGSGARSTGRLSVMFAAFVASFTFFAITVPSALATPVPTHHTKETFGSVAQPSFTGPYSLAVEQSTGDVVVANKVGTGTGKVERFAENGSAAAFEHPIEGLTFGITPGKFAVAVDNSSTATAGNVYVALGGGTHELRIYDHNGNAKTSLTEYKAGEHATGAATTFTGEICGVAAGPDGSLYVAEFGTPGMIHKYSPSGAVPGVADNTLNITVEKACLLAAGAGPSAGRFFVGSGNDALEFDASTGAEGEPWYTEGGLGGLGVDPVSGHLYVASAAKTRIVESNGPAPAGIVSSTTPPARPYGVAIDGNTGNLYVGKLTVSNLEVYGPIVTSTHSVTVHVVGSGAVSQTGGAEALSGTVSNCEASSGECTATYYSWEGPQLTATAGANYKLEAWSVEHAAATTCAGATSPCTIEVAGEPPTGEDVTATVKFALSGLPLTIEKEGAGLGLVTSVQSGLSLETISCGVHCSELFSPSTVVQLAAAAETGSEFAGWTAVKGNPGTCTGTTSPCEVTMSEAVKLKPTFTLQPEALTIDESGPGTAECEFAHSGTFEACSSPQPYGTVVNVKGTPNAGAFVESLSGTGSAAACSTGGCEFTIGEASSVTVVFALLSHPSTLTVFKGGNGTGTVMSLAPHTGIDCGVSCEEGSFIFEEGQTITLEASAAPGSVFAGWIGCRHVTASTCQVKLGSGEVEATAVFLVEGKEGATGKEGPAGPTGKEGATGKEGPIGATGKEGATGKQGPIGAIGKEGKSGPVGATGAAGARGEAGLQGVAGSVGPAGPQGAKGEPGATGKVTCTVKQRGKKVKVTCTIKYASSKAKASAMRRSLRWVLVHSGHVLAHGKTRHTPRIDLGALRRGIYTLYLQGQRKGEVIRVA